MRSTLRVLLVTLLVGVVGCGGDAVYPVQGKVQFRNQPMPGGGAISFVPLDGKGGKAAGGEIAEDGTYTLTTNTMGDGSLVGEFRVVIHQVTVKEPERTEDGERPASPANVVPASLRIPKIYSDHQNSPLRAKVEAKNSNIIDLELTPQ